MEVDLNRPPAPLNPRWPAWLILVVVWGAGFGLAILFFELSAQPSTAGVLVLASIAGLGFLVLLAWAALSLRGGQSRLFLDRYWTGQAYPQEDPSDEYRLDDREEREARRRLRRGTISRADYERIIARREFAHGELSRDAYHARIARIGEEEAELLARRPNSKSTDRPSG